jgi:hypothetical protein
MAIGFAYRVRTHWAWAGAVVSLPAARLDFCQHHEGRAGALINA